MATCPTFISLSVSVLDSKTNKEKVSYSFIARFSNGEEKVLNKTSWQAIGLRKEEHNSVTFLSKETCSLYFKDWSKNPTLGSWDKDYPEPIIPFEIASLMSERSLLGVSNRFN